MLIRRLRNVSHTSSVIEYVENFNNLMHQMLAHNPTIDQEIFTTAFIDGLKDEIRSVVTIQMHVVLDAASSLALLQKEVLESVKSKDLKRRDPSNWAKSYSPGQYYNATTVGNSQSPGSALTPRSGNRSLVEDKSGTESGRAKIMVDRVNALRSYRRARGLRFTCG
jgi:hypothetical protein